jgi:hypothetical protein
MLSTLPIVPIPEIPKEILDAIERKNLAVFAGAGVSRLVGCHSWDDLASALVRRCREEDLINFRGFDLLGSERDRKRIITVCHDLLSEHGKENIFFEEMKKSLQGKPELREFDIYDKVAKLKGLLLTTNADRYVTAPYILSRRIFDVKMMKAELIQRETVYQIHGSIDQLDSLVFTVPAYLERYRNGTTFAEFLNSVFDDNVVLFLGYGLAEFEVLDYVITRFDSPTHTQKRYTLQPYYKGDEDLLLFDAYYFNRLHIDVIPYEKDARGFEQLYDVLDEWGREIDRQTTYLSERMALIDEEI